LAPSTAGGGWFQLERSPRAIAALDGVRALAILLVLARHGVRPFVDADEGLLRIFGWDLAWPMLNGWFGVDLFFVLSGFLISGSLMRHTGSGDGPHDFRRYLARRVLRIFPAYYAVLLIAAAGVVPLYTVAPERLAARLGYHLIFFQDYFASDIVVAFWSLGVEEKFYLTAPLVWLAVAALRRRGRTGWAYGLVAAVVLLGPALRLATHLAVAEAPDYDVFFRLFRSPFHTALDPLYCGVLAALIYRDREKWPWTAQSRAGNALFWGGAVSVGWLLVSREMLAAPIGMFDTTAQPLVLSLGSGAMVLSLALGHGPVRWFSGTGLFYVSKFSYSLYLVHLLVIPGMLAWIATLPGIAVASSFARFTIFVVPYLAASTLAAAAVFYLVEQPFLRLKERLG